MSDIANDAVEPQRQRWHDQGFREGYRKGELERIALATANSELRSQLRELKGETE